MELQNAAREAAAEEMLAGWGGWDYDANEVEESWSAVASGVGKRWVGSKHYIDGLALEALSVVHLRPIRIVASSKVDGVAGLLWEHVHDPIEIGNEAVVIPSDRVIVTASQGS